MTKSDNGEPEGTAIRRPALQPGTDRPATNRPSSSRSSLPRSSSSRSSSSTSGSSRRRRSSRRKKKPAPAAPLLGTPLKIESRVEAGLMKFVDVGFAALIFLLPFVMGGRQAHGQLLLVILTAWISIGWCVLQLVRTESRWILSKVEWLLLLGIGLVIFQTIELPQSFLTSISPALETLLPTWQAETQSAASAGVWNRISLIPNETVDGMVILICYSLIFIVAVQRIRSQRDIEKLLVCLACSTALMAIFGMMQFFTSNGKFFWFYEHPFSSTDDVLKGGFTNRNHFAHFLALGIGPLFYWTAVTMNRKDQQSNFSRTGRQSNTSAIAMMAMAIVGFALMLSLSRGGMMAGAVAGGVCVFAAYRTNLLSGRIVTGLFGICLMLIVFLMVYGEADVEERVTDLVSVSAEQLDQSGGRRLIWTAVSRAIAEFPIFGTGIGSHREIYPTYLSEVPEYDLHEFTHAENGYLQLCLEAGSVGLGLTLLGFAIAIYWCFSGIRKAKSSEITLALAAGLAAILANLAHSATDFIWYCPACVVVVVLLAACSCRTRQMLREVDGTEIGFRMPKVGWIVGLILLGVMSNWMVGHKVPRMMAEKPWHDYLRLATTLLPDEDKSDHEIFREKLLALTEAERADPNFARIQTRLGRGYLTLFQMLQSRSDNPMSLAQFREAALASKFESQEALKEWLSRAAGDRLRYLELALHHAKRSVRLCPLQGQSYLYLSELAFLDMADEVARDELVAQALAVRPYHPYILFEAGKEALMSLKTETAMKHWKAAFDRNDLIQDKIVQLLAPAVTAPVMLETFNPDVKALELIAGYYRGLNRQHDLRIVLDVYATKSIELSGQSDLEADEAIEHLMAAQRCYSEMGNMVKVRQCLEAAIKVDPGAYNPRLAYGNWLYSIKRYSEAAEHLIWCAKRRPNDDRITTLAAYVRKKGMQQIENPAFAGPDFQIEGEDSPAGQPAMGGNRQPTQMAVDPTRPGTRL